MSLSNVINDILKAESAKRKALASLHTELGYASGRALADAIVEATEGTARKGKTPAASVNRAPTERRGRGLSPERKRAIADALQAGVSGTQVARDHGVSYPTVHEIKKSLGLVTPRPGKKARKKR